ncbi:hypothetical protein HK098_007104 [Nowakowskiella sp. JEL0407]|nr:hypothetical protein HK098_007104 [Nowakowskiella sp. JEL0407]
MERHFPSRNSNSELQRLLPSTEPNTVDAPHCIHCVPFLSAAKQLSPPLGLATSLKLQLLSELAEAGDISQPVLSSWTAKILNIPNLQSPIEIPCMKTLCQVLTTLPNKTKLTNFITFVNVIWFISIILGTAALLTLTYEYLKYLLLIPAVVLEIFAFIASFALLLNAYSHPPLSKLREYVGLTGAITLCGTTYWCLYKYFPDNWSIYPWILTILVFGITVVLQLPNIGVLCVWCGLWALFDVAVIIDTKIGFYIGFDIVTLTAIPSLLLLCIFTTAHVKKWNGIFIEPFNTGLIVVVSLVVTLYLGTVHDIMQFRFFGATFAVLYGICKITELPWEQIGYTWGLLVVSAALWACAYAIQKNQEYVWSVYNFYFNVRVY